MDGKFDWKSLFSAIDGIKKMVADAPRSEATVAAPEAVFPIPPENTYCELIQYRGQNTITLLVRPKGKRKQTKVYTLTTGDMAHVRRLVQADGFSPSPDDMSLSTGSQFSDPDGDYYFFTRS